ncbi:TatD family hydrolase [Ferriphaselus sp. R-1]|uniref:TatD family hydrolase n=1 Tax=Ferriphaselus sp. R-1 TaxID=1485544 RepID=UPI0005519904|nr:TatD family hydrolase [Ferriphaselus sp. R-1]
MYADSHCHLNFPELSANLVSVLDLMRANEVGMALCVGVNLEDFPQVLALAEQHDNLYASVGVHPDYEGVEEPDVARLVQLATHPRVVAIGETGLDYFRLTGDLEWQRERFRTHIRAAREIGKPLIIHTREAAADTLRLMREERAREAGGVMHCFTETEAVAQAALDMGFHISFSGIVTFKNAVALKEVARVVPLERILIETDAPYLAPVPHRGKLNQPGYVKHVAEEIARLKGLTADEVGAASTQNFRRLFGV